MLPPNIVRDLQHAFAPLTCLTSSFDAGHVGVRLLDRAGCETPEYVIELSRIHAPDDLEREVCRIRAAVEADGFRKPSVPYSKARIRSSRPAVGMFYSIRLAFRRFIQPA